MAYKGVKIYTNETFEETDCNFNEILTIDGYGARELFFTSHPYIIYEQCGVPRIKENYNRIASKLYGERIFGVAVIVMDITEEIPNDDYNEPYYDSDGGEVEAEEEEEAYITKRVDFTSDLLYHLCYQSRILGGNRRRR